MSWDTTFVLPSLLPSRVRLPGPVGVSLGVHKRCVGVHRTYTVSVGRLPCSTLVSSGTSLEEPDFWLPATLTPVGITYGCVSLLPLGLSPGVGKVGDERQF